MVGLPRLPLVSPPPQHTHTPTPSHLLPPPTDTHTHTSPSRDPRTVIATPGLRSLKSIAWSPTVTRNPDRPVASPPAVSAASASPAEKCPAEAPAPARLARAAAMSPRVIGGAESVHRRVDIAVGVGVGGGKAGPPPPRPQSTVDWAAPHQSSTYLLINSQRRAGRQLSWC